MSAGYVTRAALVTILKGGGWYKSDTGTKITDPDLIPLDLTEIPQERVVDVGTAQLLADGVTLNADTVTVDGIEGHDAPGSSPTGDPVLVAGLNGAGKVTTLTDLATQTTLATLLTVLGALAGGDAGSVTDLLGTLATGIGVPTNTPLAPATEAILARLNLMAAQLPAALGPRLAGGSLSAVVQGAFGDGSGPVTNNPVLVGGITADGSAGFLPLETGLPVQGVDAGIADAAPTANPVYIGAVNGDGFFRGVAETAPLPVYDLRIPALGAASANASLPAIVQGVAPVGSDPGGDFDNNPVWVGLQTAAGLLAPFYGGAQTVANSAAVAIATDQPAIPMLNAAATEIVVLASGPQTATYTGADLTNPGARGVAVTFDVTAVPLVTTVTLSIQVKDLASGKYTTILTGTALAVTGTNRYVVGPGITPVSNQAVNDVLSRTWRVLVTHSTTGSFTYSIGAAYIA